MSRRLQPKNKDIVSLDVKTSKDVWTKNKNGTYVLNKKYEYYGKVDKGLSSFVSITNSKGENARYVEDTCNLTKKIKNDIVKNLHDKKHKVVYLVKKK